MVIIEYSKLYMDPDISLNTLLERIEAESADKLVIIIHQKSSIFTGQVNIELIKKYARKENKELVFITQIQKIKNLLSDRGCKVYSGLEQFENQAANQETQEVKKQNYSPSVQNSRQSGVLKKVLPILLLILILGGVGFYFLFPLVTIQIKPVVKDKTVVNQVKGRYGINKIDFEQQVLPLIKKQAQIKQEVKIPATGQKKVGIRRASGKVTFINNQQQQVTIPAGTIIMSVTGVKFETLHKITVPAVKVDKLMDKVVGSKAGKATVKIKAVQPGSQGNVAEGKITDWGSKSYPVELVNSTPVTGGQDKAVKVVTEQDLTQGVKTAKEKLLTQAQEKLSDKFSDSEVFFDQYVRFDRQNIVPQTEVGTAAEQAIIAGDIKAVGFGLQKEGLKELVFKLYKRNLAAQFKLRNGQITIKGIEIVTTDSDQIVFKVKSRGKVVGRVDEKQVIQQIIGKEVSAVKELLNNLPTVDNYNIKPANQVNLPDFEFGLNLVVTEPDNEE